MDRDTRLISLPPNVTFEDFRSRVYDEFKSRGLREPWRLLDSGGEDVLRPPHARSATSLQAMNELTGGGAGGKEEVPSRPQREGAVRRFSDDQVAPERPGSLAPEAFLERG